MSTPGHLLLAAHIRGSLGASASFSPSASTQSRRPARLATAAATPSTKASEPTLPGSGNSIEPRVMVIVPPDYTNVNLAGVLGVARRAFVDPSLQLGQLNLQFATVTECDLAVAGDHVNGISRQDVTRAEGGSSSNSSATRRRRNGQPSIPSAAAAGDTDVPPPPLPPLPPPPQPPKSTSKNSPAAPLGARSSYSANPSTAGQSALTTPTAHTSPHSQPAESTKTTNILSIVKLLPTLSDADIFNLVAPFHNHLDDVAFDPVAAAANAPAARCVSFTFQSSSVAEDCYKWLTDPKTGSQLLRDMVLSMASVAECVKMGPRRRRRARGHRGRRPGRGEATVDGNNDDKGDKDDGVRLPSPAPSAASSSSASLASHSGQPRHVPAREPLPPSNKCVMAILGIRPTADKAHVVSLLLDPIRAAVGDVYVRRVPKSPAVDAGDEREHSVHFAMAGDEQARRLVKHVWKCKVEGRLVGIAREGDQLRVERVVVEE